MPRRQPQRSRGGRGPRWQLVGGSVLVAAVLVVLGLGFHLLISARESHVELDRETYCPKAGPHAVLVVILDTTDPLNQVQRKDLMNQIEIVIQDVPRFGLLEIYAVGPIDDEPPQPIFHRCNPGHADEIDPFFDNPRMVERDWREGFRKPLDQTLDEMLRRGSADTSPILESVQWVAVNGLTTPERDTMPRRLVIVSDLLQHTAGLSHYRGGPDFEEFGRTEYYRRVRAPLDSVDVDLLIVRRSTRADLQGPALIQFWTHYFEAQGISRLRIVQLAG